MKYILNPNDPWQLNGSLSDNGDGTSTQPIIITPMIEGDPYGFISSSPQKNMLNVILNNKGLDIDQLKEQCTIAAEAYCKKQYPST